MGNEGPCSLSVGPFSLYTAGSGMFFATLCLTNCFLSFSHFQEYYMKTGKHCSLVDRLLTTYGGILEAFIIRKIFFCCCSFQIKVNYIDLVCKGV